MVSWMRLTTRWAEPPVVVGRELLVVGDVPMEQAAVVHHPRDEAHVVGESRVVLATSGVGVAIRMKFGRAFRPLLQDLKSRPAGQAGGTVVEKDDVPGLWKR